LAQQAVNAFFAAGVGVVVGAEALKEVFELTLAQTLVVLKLSGKIALDAAIDSFEVFVVSEAPAISALIAAGYTVYSSVVAMQQTYDLASQEILEILKPLGLDPATIAAAVKSAFSLPVAALVIQMKAAAYSANQIATAIKTAYGQAAQEAA